MCGQSRSKPGHGRRVPNERPVRRAYAPPRAGREAGWNRLLSMRRSGLRRWGRGDGADPAYRDAGGCSRSKGTPTGRQAHGNAIHDGGLARAPRHGGNRASDHSHHVHRGPRVDRRPAHGGAGLPRRLGGLPLPAGLRLRGLLRLAPRNGRQRALEDRAHLARAGGPAALPRKLARPGDRVRHRRGDRAAGRLHARPRTGAPHLVRLVEGVSGEVRMGFEFKPRFASGHMVPRPSRPMAPSPPSAGRTGSTCAARAGPRPRPRSSSSPSRPGSACPSICPGRSSYDPVPEAIDPDRRWATRWTPGRRGPLAGSFLPSTASSCCAR